MNDNLTLSLTVPLSDGEEDYGEITQSGTEILAQYSLSTSVSTTKGNHVPPWTSRSPASSSASSSSNREGKNNKKRMEDIAVIKRKRKESTSASENRIRCSRRKRFKDIDLEDDEDEEDDEYEEEVTDSQFQRELDEIERKKKERKKKHPHDKRSILGPSVTICISGIQNPERAKIRKLANDMGAKYSSDWNRQCTHLVCALGNTPKLDSAKLSNAWIVRKEWIFESDRRGIRMPEKQFDFDSPQIVLSDDEDDDFDQDDHDLDEDEMDSDSDNDIPNPNEEDSQALDPDADWQPPSSRMEKRIDPPTERNSISKWKLGTPRIGFDDLFDSDSSDSEVVDQTPISKRQKITETSMKKADTIEPFTVMNSIIKEDVKNLLCSAKDNVHELIQEITRNALRHILQHGSLGDSFLSDWTYDGIRAPKSLRMIIMNQEQRDQNTETTVRPCTISVLRQDMLQELHRIQGGDDRSHLPSPLDGISIMLAKDITSNPTQCKQLNRIGNYLGAEVHMANERTTTAITHFVTNNTFASDIRIELRNYSTHSSFVQIIHPNWLEECMKWEAYVDERPYSVDTNDSMY